ncbi:MAG: Flp pilus assembly protein CpaB [Bdellovibrionales bacterium]|nr:Flp pilus assembly protein CpaB [Bdellovibrionales bacterium]
MNQSKAFITSIAFAGLAMILVYFYVSQREDSLNAEFGSKVPVVVASRDINEMEQIQANMLQVIEVPKKFAQPGANGDKKTFEGSVAASPVRQGEQVLMTKVLLKGAETGLASQVAVTRRALSVPVNDVSGVTRLLKPGDRIDLISNITYRTPTGPESEVKTIMQDVHVLAVGELIQNNIPSAFEDDPVAGTRKAVNLRGNRTFNTVTVEVTPNDAQSLILVMQSGAELFMSLRNPVDRVIASIPTTTVDEVLGPNSKKAEMERRNRPAPPAPAAVRVAPPPPPPNPWQMGGGSFAN